LLNDTILPKYFWAEVVNIACYIMNRALIRPILKKTPYELYNDRKPNISHLHVFGCKCFVLNNGKDNLVSLMQNLMKVYSLHSKAFRIYNKKTMIIEESIHVAFDETNLILPRKDTLDDISNSLEGMHIHGEDHKGKGKRNDEDFQIDETKTSADLPREWRTSRYHPLDNIIGDIYKGVTTRYSLKDICNNIGFVSLIEPKNLKEAIIDEHWITIMQEELNQFERNKVWELVEKPDNHPVIETKWVFRNKLDEHEIVIRNKARLVAKGYNQEEGIDYEETYDLVVRLEAIIMLVAFASIMDFKIYQMDVKSAFLNGFIQEEVYVDQPSGFENQEKPNHVFKLKKVLYGLKQTPRAWYEHLSKFLLEKGFSRGQVDTTLFIKKKLNDILLVQIYVDDIIFGSTNDSLCKEFSQDMQNEFEMSMMGELNFFLGLQIKQTKNGIFINQSKYSKDLIHRYGMENAKHMATLMSTVCYLDKDEIGQSIDIKKY